MPRAKVVKPTAPYTGQTPWNVRCKPFSYPPIKAKLPRRKPRKRWELVMRKLLKLPLAVSVSLAE